MVLLMNRPWKNPDTWVYYLRKHIPADLRPLLGNRDVYKRSLRTKDLTEAEARHAVEMARVVSDGLYFARHHRT